MQHILWPAGTTPLVWLGIIIVPALSRYLCALAVGGRHATRWMITGAALGFAAGWLAGGFAHGVTIHLPSWVNAVAFACLLWTTLDRKSGAWTKAVTRKFMALVLGIVVGALLAVVYVVFEATCLLAAALELTRQYVRRHPRVKGRAIWTSVVLAGWIAGALVAVVGYYALSAAVAAWVAAELHPRVADLLRRSDISKDAWVTGGVVVGLCSASLAWRLGVHVPCAWVALLVPVTVNSVRLLQEHVKTGSSRRRVLIALAYAVVALGGVTAAADLHLVGGDVPAAALIVSALCGGSGCVILGMSETVDVEGRRSRRRSAVALALVLTAAGGSAVGFALAAAGGTVSQAAAIQVGAPALAVALSIVAAASLAQASLAQRRDLRRTNASGAPDEP